MSATPLVVIPEERRLAEVRRAQAAGRAHGTARRRAFTLAAVCAACLLGGFWLLGLSFHLTNRDLAEAVFLGGLLVGNFGPLFTLLLAHWWEMNR